MGLTIHAERMTPEVAAQLTKLCPFGALQYDDGKLMVTAACRACKLCVKGAPAGAVTWEDEAQQPTADQSAWRGVAVYADFRMGALHPVTMELLGKAGELAKSAGQPVYALLIGSDACAAAKELLQYGADKVYVYDDPAFQHFTISPYANAFYDFIEKVRPSSILVGATNLGRSLAPKVAARCNTGLTADCTVLRMKENGDLVQIRPAFGGNIMAEILTPHARPQFCTVRYKIFSAPPRMENPRGEIVRMEVKGAMRHSGTEVLYVTETPKEIDLSDAETIVACGRGFRKESDLDMARELCTLLHAQLAGTRPLIENGWLDPKRQIGLSGRTVKPQLILALGISGSVQFAAGMRGSDWIIAVNEDPNAAIFDIAHVCAAGDLYEVVPRLIDRIREGRKNV